MDISVNKNSHVPIYYQIQEQIREQIGNKDLNPGTQLPTERELSQELGVSRVTVRKAIRGLIAEGICSKKVGKGIFVAEEKIPTNVYSLEGTSYFVAKLGLKLTTRVIIKEVISGSEEVNHKLDNEDGQVLHLQRVRYIEGEPMMLEETYLPLYKFPGLAEKDFKGSLYEILKSDYQIVPHHSQGTFNVNLAKEKEARLLNLQLNTALLEKEAIVFSKTGQPIEYSETTFRSDKFTFVFTSTVNS